MCTFPTRFNFLNYTSWAYISVTNTKHSDSNQKYHPKNTPKASLKTSMPDTANENTRKYQETCSLGAVVLCFV